MDNSPTLEEFLRIYDDFSSHPKAKFELESAKNEVVEENWGNKYKQGVYLLTAHYLTLNDKEEARGIAEVNAIATGGTGIRTPSNPTDHLDSTFYGQRYKALFELIPVAPIVIQ